MNGQRCRRRRRWVALALAPPLLLWSLVVFLCPTEWARSRIERELANATKSTAKVGSVRIGLLGGIYLQRVELIDPQGDPNQPGWLRARLVAIDLSGFPSFTHGLQPRRVHVDGLILRLGRDDNGRFPLARLLGSHPSEDTNPPARSNRSEAGSSPFPVQIERGLLLVSDQPSGSSSKIESIRAHAVIGPESIELDEFEGQVRGGLVRVAAEISRGSTPSFDARLTSQRVQIGRELKLLDLILPFLPGIERDQVGLVDAEVELTGSGRDFDQLLRSLRGRGRLAFDPIRLDRSVLTSELSKLVPLPPDARVGSLRSEFLVQDQRITSTCLRLALGSREVKLSGFTSFDGQIGYQMDVQGLAERLAERWPQILGSHAIESSGLLHVEIEGTVERPILLVNGRTLTPGPTENNTLREIGRSLRQRFLR